MEGACWPNANAALNSSKAKIFIDLTNECIMFCYLAALLIRPTHHTMKGRRRFPASSGAGLVGPNFIFSDCLSRS
ncbi:MAG: hypothetical protein QOE96_1184 [Blastocatellia bacterium]|nr:hypothetical protein [Blastocatellia bacterium]